MRKLYLAFICLFFLQYIHAQINYDNPLDSGVLVMGGKNIFNFAEPVTDGKNGVLILFNTYQKSDTIFVQRINSAGQIVWGSAGNAKIAAVKSSQDADVEIWSGESISDGNGGIFISYYEIDQSLEEAAIYIQHIDSNGNRLMTADGVKVAGNGHRMIRPVLVSDGGSGIILGWLEDEYDYQNGSFQYSEAFVQKFNSTGTPQWQSGGIQVCHSDGLRRDIILMPDGNNGAVAVFTDSRNSIPVSNLDDNMDVYAQRINNDGVLQWSPTGVSVSTRSSTQQLVKVIKQTDGQGYLICYSTHPGGNFTGAKELSIQRLNNTGQITWPQDGSLIANAEEGYGLEPVSFEPDGAGGAVLYWNAVDSVNFDYTAFIQRVNASGNTVWTSSPISLLSNPGAHHTALNMSRDVQGHFVYAVIAETADYSDGNFKLQKVDSSYNSKWGVAGKNYSFRGDIIVPTNDGFVIIFLRNYGEELTVPPYSQYENLLAYKIDFNGNLLWSSTPYRTMADGDWNDPLIWEAGFVPPAAGNVVISNQVQVTENAVCNSLKILPGGKVTVETGSNLAVLH